MDCRKRLISIALSFCLICSSWGVIGAFAEEGADIDAAGGTAASESVGSESENETEIGIDEASAGTGEELDATENTNTESTDEADDQIGAEDTEDEAIDAENMIGDADLTGSESGEFTAGLAEDAFDSLDIGSDDELLEGYLMSNTAEESAVRMEKAPRSWNLSGNNLFYYNWVRSLAQNVAAGKRSYTYDSVAGSKILSKKTYKAADLGLSVVAKRSGNSLVLTAAAQEKIRKLLAPEDWSAVLTDALLDMPYELYWFNRYNSTKCLYKSYWSVTFTTTSVTFDTDPSKTYTEIWLPLIEEYGKETGTNYYIYVADTSKTGAASAALANAKQIVAKHANESDYSKLKSYLEEVCELTEYDYAAASLIDDTTLQNYQIYNSPWQLISVFDGDPSTNVVCAGYGKAFKYLCDLTAFKSNWIECQTMYGTVQNLSSGNPAGSHLWCTVRMNNGKNYIVDPTWHDGGFNMFLQGGSYNSSTGACDVSTTPRDSYVAYTIRYTYEDTMKKTFSASELRIESSDYDPYSAAANDVPIPVTPARVSGIKAMTYTGSALTGQHPVVKVDGRTLKEGVDYVIGGYRNNVKVGKGSFTITGIGQYIGTVTKAFNILPKGTKIKSLKKGKKSFTVKWNKQSAKMNTARITGYQIQYSTSSKFTSGNKTVKVKGYKSKSKTIKKLKSKKRYYVRIRTYRKIGGVTYYSPWSPAKSVKTK